MNVLNKFGALRELSVPYVADDDLLGKLGGGCRPLLERLAVPGSWEVTDQGQMVVGLVGWQPSHFAQCGERQKLLSSALTGSPVSPLSAGRLVQSPGGRPRPRHQPQIS